MLKALIVGGTGPSGPILIRALQERGYDVTILHRGVHEPDELPPVEHIHTDPHFAEPLIDALGSRSFDVVYGLYGRLEVLADVFAGRCGRFIAVGGRPIYAGYLEPKSTRPSGMAVMAKEEFPLADPAVVEDERAGAFIRKMRAAEDAVFEHHRRGSYRATLFRYPYIYGPRALGTIEWSVMKRIRDGRRTINLPSAGLVLGSRCSAINAAHYLTLALERQQAEGEIFNCADDQQYSLAQWVEMIGTALGVDTDIVDVPQALRWTVSHFLFFVGRASDIALMDIAKAKRLLGYADKVAPADALEATVRWYEKNPPDQLRGSKFPDRFDYELEDSVAEALAALGNRFRPLDPLQQPVHTYAHPKVSSLQQDEKGR